MSATWVPMRLAPILKPRIWGGTALRDDWGKVLPTDEPYGESWELVWRPEDMTRVAGGPHAGRTLAELAADDRAGLLGTRLASLPEFPLLAKLLDCRERLSVQVHPTAAYIRAHAGAEIKMEAWYVLDAPRDATLIFGVQPGTTRAAFAAAVAEGRVADTLASRPVRRGDVLLVQPGTVHALLEGLMVYEIQQSSDTTYRVYDWDRVDATGHARELHVPQALDCIAFDVPPPAPITPLPFDAARSLLVATPAFALERVVVGDTWCGVLDGTRCELVTVVEGRGAMDGVDGDAQPGDSFLIPAGCARYELAGQMTVLRAYLPDWRADVWEPARAAGFGEDAIRAACGGFGPDAAT